MSRSQNLRHNVINQVIDDMARGQYPFPTSIAKCDWRKCTTSAALQCVIFSSHLRECGVLNAGVETTM